MASPFSPRFSLRPENPRPWEPALAQLRRLPAEDLDRLVGSWLRRSGLQLSRRIQRQPGTTTYRVLVGNSPFSFQLAVRVHQRDNRLQPHHIEAFLGFLSRQNLAAGVLVSTAGYAPAALCVAAGSTGPRIRVLSGAEWLQELVTTRASLDERPAARWYADFRWLRRRRGPGSTD